MHTNPLRSILKCSTLVGASCLLANLSTTLQASPVLNETFNTPLSAEKWAVEPANAADAAAGVLTIHAKGSDSDYAVTGVRLASALDKLNFVKNTVQITLTNLDITGDASTDRQIFHMILSSDSANDLEAASRLQLRIARDGSLSIAGQDKGAATPIISYEGTVSLPIKSLKLTLKPTGATLSIEDANGPKSQDIAFTAPLTAWASSTPYLRLQSQRNPGSGETVVTLHGFGVDSEPIPAK